ncbi:MAG: hypothetical protein NTX00_00680 [Candidatus Parcubacteria bacterium]|nr:hypothetical protein [Candidatus Parcubacteria bacterium]
MVNQELAFFTIIYEDNTPFKGDRSSSLWATDAEGAKEKFKKSMHSHPYKPNGHEITIITHDEFKKNFEYFFVFFPNGNGEEHFTTILARNRIEALEKFAKRHFGKNALRIRSKKEFVSEKEEQKKTKIHKDEIRTANPIRSGALIATRWQPVAA